MSKKLIDNPFEIKESEFEFEKIIMEKPFFVVFAMKEYTTNDYAGIHAMPFELTVQIHGQDKQYDKTGVDLYDVLVTEKDIIDYFDTSSLDLLFLSSDFIPHFELTNYKRDKSDSYISDFGSTKVYDPKEPV